MLDGFWCCSSEVFDTRLSSQEVANQRCIFLRWWGFGIQVEYVRITVRTSSLISSYCFCQKKQLLCGLRPSCRARRMWLKSWWKLVRMLCKAIWMAWAHYSLLPTWWPRREMTVSEGCESPGHTKVKVKRHGFHGTWSGVSYVFFWQGSCYILCFVFWDPAVLTGVVDPFISVGEFTTKCTTINLTLPKCQPGKTRCWYLQCLKSELKVMRTKFSHGMSQCAFWVSRSLLAWFGS